MSYTPTNWSRGDVVTSAKLNKLEEGVAEASGSGGGRVLVVTYDMGATNKTWQQIYDAMMSGGAVIYNSMLQDLTAIKSIGHGKTYLMADANGNEYTASSPDDVLQKLEA